MPPAGCKVCSERPQAFDDGDVQMLQLMASAIVAALAKKASLDARSEAEARLRASIGISLYKPPADASRFLREADHAMYHAKHHHDEVEGVSAFMSDAEFLD